MQDKVGDVMSVEEFLRDLNVEEEDRTDFKAKAYKYYRMAAEAGNSSAMTELGRRLYDGIGVEKNVEESDEWYRLGAEAGDPAAMRVVAFRTDNAEEKFKYFKISAELLPPSLNKQDSIKQTAICYARRDAERKRILPKFKSGWQDSMTMKRIGQELRLLILPAKILGWSKRRKLQSKQ